MIELLESLRSLGVELAMDDFGTGSASISQLTSPRFDCVKIDKSFVTGIEHDERSRAPIEAMLLLAARLGLRTVAEGVESEGEARLLERMGCSALQGWALGRPLPAAEIERLLEREKPE